jgi:hypothetical protein
VSTCSIRGSFGWPSVSHDNDNLDSIGNFYMGYYAHALKDFQRKHKVSMDELAAKFFEGFAFRTHVMSWQLSVMRDKFEDYSPGLPASFGFGRKWQFILWSLERQERRLDVLKGKFFRKVELVSESAVAETAENFTSTDEDNEIEIIDEDIRYNS